MEDEKRGSGVARIVVLMRSMGLEAFSTSDDRDPLPGLLERGPYVAMVVDREQLFALSHRVSGVVRARVILSACESGRDEREAMSRLHVEASYVPETRTARLLLTGVTDGDVFVLDDV